MLALLLSTAAAIVVARNLGPAAYGQVSLVIAVLTLLSIPSNNAMVPLLTRRVAQYQHAHNAHHLAGLLAWSRRLGLLTALGGVAAMLCWALYDMTWQSSGYAHLFVIASPAIVCWALGAQISGTLQGLRRVVLAQLFDWALNPAFYLILLVGMLMFGQLSPFNVLLSMVVALAMSVAIGSGVLRRNIPAEVRSATPAYERSDWLGSWRSFTLIQALSVANTRAPILLIGILGTASEAGLFRVAENVATLLGLSLLVINAALGPHIARLHDAGKLQELERIARGFARFALAVTLPAGIVVWLAGEWLLTTIFGAGYTAAYSAMVILIISQVINISCGSVGLILNMTGHEQRALRSFAIALVANVVFGFLLIPAYGAVGAALAAALSTVVWNLFLLLSVKQTLGIRPAVL